MSLEVSFSLLGWSAWIASESEKTPPLEFIPALQRRRFSRLSRISLQVAYDCAKDNHHLRTVFCSRHGEIHRTHGLLSDLAINEALSPMAFSLSVHNTASGLYSIASGNTAPSTAIAAGRDTLAMAVIEAIGQLHHSQNPAEKILVVFADEPLPDDYVEFADEATAPYGLALLLGKEKMGTLLQLKQMALKENSLRRESMGLGLLSLLNGDTSVIDTRGENSLWRWSRL